MLPYSSRQRNVWAALTGFLKGVVVVKRRPFIPEVNRWPFTILETGKVILSVILAICLLAICSAVPDVC